MWAIVLVPVAGVVAGLGIATVSRRRSFFLPCASNAAIGQNAELAMSPNSEKTQAFYRWVDSEGRVHVVSSLDAVPVAERARVERVTLNGATAVNVEHRKEAAPAWQPEPASFALGFGAALVLSLIFRLLPNGWRGVTRVAVVLGVAVLLSALYLGAVRRATGVTGGSALAAPSALIEDAKAAVEKMQARQKQQEEELRKIQAEGR
jgi:hypothetical protein